MSAVSVLGVSTAQLRTLDDASFESDLASSTQPTLVCFSASTDSVRESWLQEIEATFGDRLRVVISPLEFAPKAAMRHGVVLTPAYVVLDHGRKKGLAVGALSVEDLTRFVTRVLE